MNIPFSEFVKWKPGFESVPHNRPASFGVPILEMETFPFVDPGVRRFVQLLNKHDVETFESCESDPGHCFLEPTVRFHGGQYEGFRALGIAMMYAMPVADLRRYWTIQNGEPVGPKWEMTFTIETPVSEPSLADNPAFVKAWEEHIRHRPSGFWKSVRRTFWGGRK